MNRITWSAPAVDDVQDVADRLRLNSRNAALRFVARVDDSLKKIASQPYLGRVVPELERHDIGRYREIILSPWRLFYRIDGDQI